MTWRPWNPVATKKVDPYTESAIAKGASIYSKACRAVKYTPKATVIASLWRACVWLDSIRAWWDHVTVAPEARRIAVFNRGIEKGLKDWIPAGGQQLPSSTVGDSLLWKKAQKKEKKNNTSDVINKIIPHWSPIITFDVWSPWYVPSRVTSRHHWIIVSSVAISPKIRRSILYWWNHFTRPVVNIIALIDPVKGQGLISTRWYVWCPWSDISLLHWHKEFLERQIHKIE